jgi:hypothetical protein
MSPHSREISMGMKKIGGVILVVVGIGIAFTGYQMSGSVGNQIGSAFSGSPSDNVMLRYLAGAASVGVGVFLAK